MSAQQIIAQLTAATQRLDECHSKIAAAREDAGQARQLVGAALEGSSGQLVAQIDKLLQALTTISQFPGQTKEQVQQTIQRTKALGN